MKTMLKLVIGLSFTVISFCSLAKGSSSTILTLDYRFGANIDSSDINFSRFSLNSQTRFTLNNNWTAEFEVKAEYADDNVGLGTIDGYSSISKPLVDKQKARLEVDRAFIQWRKRAHSWIIGKQVTPWGVLDGVQITDRFDPVRRRDFVFTDVRPERIARWGARWRNKLGQYKFDASLALDGTVSQQAEPDALFFTSSTRFTGGLDISNVPVSLNSQQRNSKLNQSTFGVRVSHSLGEGDLSLLVFRGPDTDPVLNLSTPPAQGEPILVELTHHRRTLMGANYDVNVGETVWRMEVAYIPDQQINIKAKSPLLQTSARRLLAGIGVDWRAPNQWFVNAQLALDYLHSDSTELVRPVTDTILTLRVQRYFFNGRILFKGELLGTVNEGDGVLRPELAFEYNDNIKLRTGVDWLFGDKNGLFGQFKDESRIWLAATYTF